MVGTSFDAPVRWPTSWVSCPPFVGCCMYRLRHPRRAALPLKLFEEPQRMGGACVKRDMHMCKKACLRAKMKLCKIEADTVYRPE